MKAKLLLMVVLVLVTVYARAEKSYIRDRSECVVEGQKFTVALIGREVIVESPDDDYGESIQIRHDGSNHSVDLKETLSGRYRFLRGQNNLCSKPLALQLSKDEIALFLGRDNRPFAPTLVVLNYNTRTRSSLLVPTTITTNLGVVEEGVAFFKVASLESANRYGNVTINSSNYRFAERVVAPWLAFDGKGFKLDQRKTYEKFEFKELVSPTDLRDVSESHEVRYRLATNMALGSACLSMNSADWVCNK